MGEPRERPPWWGLPGLLLLDGLVLALAATGTLSWTAVPLIAAVTVLYVLLARGHEPSHRLVRRLAEWEVPGHERVARWSVARKVLAFLLLWVAVTLLVTALPR